uniref:Ribonuclease H-like domain-containing protein n=1 Tax=Tanacetum cinerariifolium TaxID=118510 RepID=A0A6L2JUX5_TANCI|nr:ribonuclease H-like domain-containing protein [Tanacetum cinerariifolium]
MNMSLANKAYFEAEKETIHPILIGIRDEIYSTVDAFQIVHEMWEAIERLQQGESLNIQDVKTNLFWEFGKEIAKPVTPSSETASEDDSDPEQAPRDKDMQKNLALIAKYFKKIYKPTNNNLRTSSNSRNKNVDTTLRKPKRVKDSAYHKEKMLLCKQAEQGVSLPTEQYDWLADTNEEFDEQELEAHYSYMEKIQEVPTADSGTDSEPLEQVHNNTGYNVFSNYLQHSKQSESISNTCLVETDDSNVIPDSPNMCDDDIQNDQNDVDSDDERMKEYKTILAKTSKTLGESNSVRDSCLVALQNKQVEFEKYKAFNDYIIDYDKLERMLNETIGQLAQKDIEIKEGLKTKAYEISVVKEKHDELIKHILLTNSHYEGLVKQKTKIITDLKLTKEHDIDKMLLMEKQLKFLNEIVYKRRQSIQTIHMMEPKVSTYNGRPTFTNQRYFKWAQSEIPCLYAFPYDQSTHANKLIPNGPQHKSNQLSDKVVPNNSQVKVKKTQVEDHPRIPSISNKINLRQFCVMEIWFKEISLSTGFIMSKASIKISSQLVNFVMRIWRLSHLNFDYINLLSKKDVVIGLPKLKYVKDQLCFSCELSKAKRSSFKSKAVPSSKGRLNLLHIDLCGPIDGENLDKMKEKGDMCILVGYSTQSKGYRVYNKRTRLIVESIHIRFDEIKECLRHAHVPSQQELDLLFGPLYDEFFNACSNPQDKQPTTNIQPTSAPSTPTYIHAEENNDDQVEEERLPDDKFTNPFCAPTQEVAESSSHNIGNSNVPTFNQPQFLMYNTKNTIKIGIR